VAIFAAAVVVIAVAVVIWWFGRTPPQEAVGFESPTGQAPSIVDPGDPLPKLESRGVTSDSQGDPVFTWHNPSPQAGDQYHWSYLTDPDEAHTVGEVRLALPRSDFGDGAVCVEVRLVRGERTSNDPVRICEE
jgi:hypothetical protein